MLVLLRTALAGSSPLLLLLLAIALQACGADAERPAAAAPVTAQASRAAAATAAAEAAAAAAQSAAEVAIETVSAAAAGAVAQAAAAAAETTTKAAAGDAARAAQAAAETATQAAATAAETAAQVAQAVAATERTAEDERPSTGGGATAAAAPGSGTYTVQPGDTLSAIASRFGTTVAALTDINALENPDLLLVGAVLILPGGEPEMDEGGGERNSAAGAPTGAAPARLERVVDGDTIVVHIGSAAERVRLIGIDTPERGEPWAAEATARTEVLLDDGALYLETDATERDRYGRLLRYVWVRDTAGEWLLVNLVLVAEGLAAASPVPPDDKYAERFRAAEVGARAEGHGIWTPAPEPEPPPTPVQPSRNCHSSYPSVCIPPPPPDLDCGEIPYRRFRVVGADPHRFDGDRDGVGCES